MSNITRRSFIRSGVSATLAVNLTLGCAFASDVKAVRTQRAYGTDWSAIRGFNYQPSYGRTGTDIWYNFDAGRIAAELALGKLYFPKINAIRIWLAFDAFVGREDAFKRNLESYIRAVDAIGCKAMPILFNRWRALPDWGTIDIDHFLPGSLAQSWFEKAMYSYLDATIGAHRADERVLAWDLCNEPYFNQSAAGNKDDTPKVVADAETAWLRSMYRRAKELKPAQPVTIAAHGAHPLSKFNEFSDILSIHPYMVPSVSTEDQHENELDEHVAYANQVGKPLLASECCWGEEDDAEHVKLIAYSLSQLRQRGIGFMPDSLHHSLVGDEHRAEYGPVWVEMMAFIEADGRLRTGHEVYNEF